MKVALSKSSESKAKLRIDLIACDAGNASAKSGLGVSECFGRIVAIQSSQRGAPSRLIASLGKTAEIDAERIRRTAGLAAQWLIGQSYSETVALSVESRGDLDAVEATIAAAEGFILGSYRFDRHKTSDSNRRKNEAMPKRIELLTPRVTASLRSAINRAQQVCAGTTLARDVAHEPPNVINPVTLATRARKVARQAGLTCKVFDHKQLERMGMGGIIAVGRASKTPPRLIEISYRPKSGANKKPIVLIGKAVTFDTGGYTIKPGTGMLGMKYDKCGGAAVLGAMRAVASDKPRVPVVGLIAAAENMISGDAYRPDDIIKMKNGKTVQIVSADAEGRMLLADALAYAHGAHKPRAMIDLATLTGGVVVALGKSAAGIFSNDESLTDALVESGQRVHERLWPLPVWDEYADLIKGDDSDLKNSAGREAHAICGAIFLKQFVDAKTPWAHLDIAGMSDVDSDQPYCPKGATGFGVRLLADYLMRLK